MSSASGTTAAPEFRAAATDLSERRRSGVSSGPVIDLLPSDEIEIVWGADGAATIGAFATIAAIGADGRLAAAYPGVTATANGLAMPQIRHVATLGGNLAQRSRCWYFRNPHLNCLKKGGDDCPARSGNHLYGVAFDLGSCVAPHPSSMAVALAAYEASIATDKRSAISVSDLFGDGSNGRADHALQSGEAIRRITLPPPLARERALYKRAISRSFAEWPLVELCARAVIENGAFRFVRLAAGGVAPVPLRLTASEMALTGAPATEAIIADAARQAVADATPLPMTGYKLDLLSGLMRDLLMQLAA